MRRQGWIQRLLLIVPVAVMLVLSGDALAGDKGGKKDKKDKKDKKGKKEKIDKERKDERGSSSDPIRRENYENRLKSSGKEQDNKGSGKKSQARTRSVKRVQKRATKRSGGGKK